VEEMRLKDTFSQSGNMTEMDYYKLGSSYLKLEAFDQAVEYLVRSEDMGMRHPWLYYNLAIAHHQLGDPEKACNYLNMSGERGEMIDMEVFEQLCGDE
jgi:tetratricopeptide (TPR) repeat protein